MPDALALASEQRQDRVLGAEIDKTIDLLLANYERVTANPRSMGSLRFLLKHYAKSAHPWKDCFTADTPVDCPRDHARFPDGVPISQLNPGDLVWSFNVEQYVFELKPVIWASMTRRGAQLAMLTLDDGAQIKATPDHKFMRRDTTWVELQDLRPRDSLMPLYRDYLPMVRRNPDSLSWAPEHRLVADYLWPERKEGTHVHHRDVRRSNTSPSNFAVLTGSEHAFEHHRTVRELLAASGIVRECRGCGQRFEPAARNQRLCGECPASLGYVRKVVGHPRACHHCSTEFIIKQPNQVFCSTDCRDASYQKGRFCRECGVDLRPLGRSFVWCDEHRPRATTKEPMEQHRLCRNCGAEFKPASGVQRHCSATCRKQYSQRKWNRSPESAVSFNHKVASVVLLDERQDVWDIEVADNHSFVVRGIVAHNCYHDNFKRFGPKTAALCGVLKDAIRQGTTWRGKGPRPSDHGAPGVAIAEADAPFAPPFGGHHGHSAYKLSEGCLDKAFAAEFGVDEVPGEVFDLLFEIASRCDVTRVLLGLDEPPVFSLEESA